jgi:hypothetical protein
VDSKLGSGLIGGTSADLKKIGKAQDAILRVLKPHEKLIFVAADTNSSGVWAFTDQRLLETLGKSLSHDLPLLKIANTKVKYMVMANRRDVRYYCSVYWLGGPLRDSWGNVNSNGFLMLERFNGEDEVQRIAALIDARLAEPASAPQAPAPAANGPASGTKGALDEGWFIAWVNGIQSSMTPTAFQAAMGAQTPLDATTNGLIRACEQVFQTCFGMIQANCPPQSLKTFEAQVRQDWLNVTPWGLIGLAVDLDPTRGASRREWEAAIRQVVEDELGTLRQSIVGGR